VLTAGTALHHKLAHVLGGLGLPHAQTHAIILPHVTRFNLAAADDARARLIEVLGGDPADALARMLASFPIPQRLRDIGLRDGQIDDVGDRVARLKVTVPRAASAADVRQILTDAY
jgi:alcohol dehydrogenase class IV